MAIDWESIRKIHDFLPESSEGWHQHENGGGWVQDTATVDRTAFVGESALVFNEAKVLAYAEIHGSARVFQNANVSGCARITQDARVYGTATVDKHANVYGQAEVFDNAVITDQAEVFDNAVITDQAQVLDKVYARNRTRISGKTTLSGHLHVWGDMVMSKQPLVINGLDYPVIVCDKYLTVGCQQHTPEQWLKFPEEDLSLMDSMANAFKEKYMDWLQSICKIRGML